MQTVPRLLETFRPDHYQLFVQLDQAKQRIFSSQVSITGTPQLTGYIQLHAKDLRDIEGTIDNTPVSCLVDGETLTVSSPLIKSGKEVTIHISSSGHITDAMHGLYPCYYEHDGTKKELYATQLESHHAREVFPCIDEPEAKAIFEISLLTTPGLNVIGNMPIKSQEEVDTLERTSFLPTPRMSPYLVAFVVGELHKKSAVTQRGVEVNIWATPTQAPQSLEFALDVAVRAIEFYEDYFDAPYPLPKADHVALPDFAAGGMENWGLMTYREICLIADKDTSIAIKERVAVVIAHETAHQWFGDLVTMKWWDDLWLNESFATLMEYICTDALFPDWNIWMTFATNEMMSAMRRDYLPNVQPVKLAVNHPDEIGTLFDPSIVYAKGARLLAMLHRYIGDEAFKNGLRQYFKIHAYKNTTADDLWAALSSASQRDIAGFMTPWLTQPGFPIVSLSRTSMRQQRFVLGGDNPTPDAVWPIPIGSSGHELPELFESKDEEFPQVFEDTRINNGGHGHFITHYADEDLWANRIASVGGGAEINPANRLTLLHDASLLARAGDISARDLFELTRAYQNETDGPVWDIVSYVIGDLKRFVESNDTHEKKFKAHVIQLVREKYKLLEWEPKKDEQESQTKLRATIVGLLAYAEDENIIKKCLDTFHSSTDISHITGELRPIIFAVATQHGTPEDADTLLAAYRTTHSTELKNDIAIGLCTACDPLLIDRLITLLTDDSFIRAQDLDRWFANLMRNRYARESTWLWLTTQWPWIKDKFEGDIHYDSFVRYSASALSTSKWLVRYTQFFQLKRDEIALTRAIDLGISDIATRAEWIDRDNSEFVNSL